MSQIIELIKILRQRTGAGMMDCKRALEENNLDVEQAIDWLRQKGITKVANKSSRIAAEGLSLIYPSDDKQSAILVEINCETDFVSRSDSFKNMHKQIALVLLNRKPDSLELAREAIKDILSEATMKIGEKLAMRRFEIYHKSANQIIGQYIHMEGKIATLTLIEGGNQELADNLAMHITANSPSFISSDKIPEAVKLHETNIQKEIVAQDEKLSSKPEAAISKIIEGKVAKIFKEATLHEQSYLLDESGGTVKATLDKTGAKVIKFTRYQVGEGIEKRIDNFAEEVMAQVK
jgi:elongation factor Ts